MMNPSILQIQTKSDIGRTVKSFCVPLSPEAREKIQGRERVRQADVYAGNAGNEWVVNPLCSRRVLLHKSMV